jgi:hypothetical protein
LSEAIIPRKGERIRKDSPSERKTDRTTHQKSPIGNQIHISVHIKKEKQESQTYRKEKEIPPLPPFKKEKKKILQIKQCFYYNRKSRMVNYQ